MSRANETCDAITFVKAMDLIKVADQIFKDGMKYVQIDIHFDDYDDDRDGEVRISAVPSIDSSDVKEYPVISPSRLCYFE